MNWPTRIQLSTLMFLEFFIWGAWTVSMGGYLANISFTGNDIGAAYSTGAVAAIISPFFVGMIADRFFSAEKVMAFLHIVGGAVLMWVALTVDPRYFFWVLLLYMLFFMPTGSFRAGLFEVGRLLQIGRLGQGRQQLADLDHVDVVLVGPLTELLGQLVLLLGSNNP